MTLSRLIKNACKSIHVYAQEKYFLWKPTLKKLRPIVAYKIDDTKTETGNCFFTMFPTYVQIVTLVFSERQEKTGCTRCPILRALYITCSLLFIYISCLYILQRVNSRRKNIAEDRQLFISFSNITGENYYI